MSESELERSATAIADWTIFSVLRWASEDFRRRGIDNARLDAELLLADALEVNRIQLIIDAKRSLSPSELEAFKQRIKRRRAGEPVAYILGVREFYGLPMRVSSHVLIPRPDTETLVDVALERTRQRDMYGRALDLCTGSGCVGIAFAKARPTWRVTLADLSRAALAVAHDNVLRLGAAWGLRLLESDLFSALAPAERFELITANPPYIPSGDIPGLDPGIAKFEPHLALDGGVQGLDVVQRIITAAPAWLVPGGVLALEIGAGQSERVHELFARAGFTAIERRRDYGGHERVVSGVM